jgi:hypothetical protein
MASVCAVIRGLSASLASIARVGLALIQKVDAYDIRRAPTVVVVLPESG